MKDTLGGDLNPSRKLARHMHELESELRRARSQQRRYSKSPDTLGRWRLEQPAQAQQEEGWFITYLDMMTLLLVAMIVMLAFSGSVGQRRSDADSEQMSAAASSVAAVPPAGAPSVAVPPTAAPSAAADAAEPADTTEASPESEPSVTEEPLSQAESVAILPPMIALETSPAPASPATPPAARSSTSGPLPPDATVIPGISAATGDGFGLANLYPGWSAADLAASFVGPPRPSIETVRSMAAAGPHDAPASGPREVMADSESETSAKSAAQDIPPADDPPTEGETLAAGLALGELGNDVEVVVNERSVSFRVNSEILFDSSQADLSREGLGVLRRIAAVVAESGHEITVEGHTDSVPVRRNVRYPSNWELSSSRAGSVVRYLQANGVDKTRLKAIGYADARPIADNHTPEGRARNRRVELIIEKRGADSAGPSGTIERE